MIVKALSSLASYASNRWEIANPWSLAVYLGLLLWILFGIAVGLLVR